MDTPDYWCIVALNYSNDSAFIMAESDDCENDDVIYDGPDIDEVTGLDWAKDRPAGLYRLTLSYDDNSGEVNVLNTECLMTFPALANTTSAVNYLDITRNIDYVPRDD
jgi:hypothetical protein